MRKFHIIIFCLLLLSTMNKADAQTRDTVLLTVEEAIALALQNNFDILLARNDSAVAALDYSYVNAAFLPRVNANTSAIFNNSAQRQTLADGRKVERNGIRSNNIAASVGLNWTVFDGFRMFILKDRAEELVELGELLIKEQIITSISDVVKNYYNIVRQKQQLRTVEEQMSISEDRLKLSQYRLDIGVGVKPDVLQALIDLNAQRAAALNQLTLIEQLKQQLNQLMNVTPASEYDVVDTIPVRTDITLSELAGLETTNPALLVSQKNIELAELTVKERKAERFPTVALTSAYNFSQTNNQAVINPFQPIFNMNRGFNYGITASIPILNNFNVRRQIKQAELDVQYRQLQFESQRSLINTTLINAFKAYELQKRAVALEEENIKYVRENLFIVRERYRLAATPYIELREAQRSLEDAYTRLITARYNLKVAETDLLRLKGDIVR